MGLIFFRHKNDKYAKKYAKLCEDKSDKRKRRLRGFLVFLIIFIPTLINTIQFVANIDTSNLYKELNDDDIVVDHPINETNVEDLKTKFYNCGLTNLSENFSPLNISSRSKNTPTSELSLSFEEYGYLANTLLSFVSSNSYNITISGISWTKNEDSEIFNISLTGKMNADLNLDTTSDSSQTLSFYFIQTYTIKNSMSSFVFTNFRLLNTSSDNNSDSLKNLTKDMAFLMFANENECDSSNQSLCYMLGFSTYKLTNDGITLLLGE